MNDLQEQVKLINEKLLKEQRNENYRHYWLKNIHELRDKLQKPNIECQYNLSLSEVTLMVIALEDFKQNFFNGDCEPLLTKLCTRYKSKKKHFRQFKKLQQQEISE